MGFDTITYTYRIEYSTAGSNSNADVMSRLPVSPAEEEADNVFQTTYLEELPITASDIRDATRVNQGSYVHVS